MLVKKANHSGKATIYYHDIGDYLNREEKLDIVRKMCSIENPAMQWQTLTPNEHNDWVNHRNDKFGEFISLSPEKKFEAKTESVFTTYAIGVATNRDTWVYNFSKEKVKRQIEEMIDFYNEQTKAYEEASSTNSNIKIEDFINTDETKISWTVNLKRDIKKGTIIHKDGEILKGMYRPFSTQHLYFDKHFIERPGLSKNFSLLLIWII
ncbi:putative helicase [Bacteroidales bacterium Barb4]|nr:putative helicase [Bacteroidales bacterium Barb4]